nr:PREDICTED: N-alpha-acetyltransferase 30-like [Bemisia tabaci]
MDSVHVSNHEEIGKNVISIGITPGKLSQVPENFPNNIHPNPTLAEDLRNLTVQDDSVKSKKHTSQAHASHNGVAHAINFVPDEKHRSSSSHPMDDINVEKSSQYQSCSEDAEDTMHASVCNCEENHNNVESENCVEVLRGISDGCPVEVKEVSDDSSDIRYVLYESELQMPDIMRLIQKDLSEPYSIYTYRYFIHNWPNLCFLAMHKTECVGAIVCKLDMHRKVVKRGYIAMLAVDEKYRKRKIGSNLVLKAIKAMVADMADEVVLETEITNQSALRLYENLGFVRDKRLFRYYLNGVDALRLKLWLR